MKFRMMKINGMKMAPAALRDVDAPPQAQGGSCALKKDLAAWENT